MILKMLLHIAKSLSKARYWMASVVGPYCKWLVGVDGG